MNWIDNLEGLSADTAHCVYSQNGEEGVLEAIFAGIGETNRVLVDIGAGDGIALSNTRLFIENGWAGARFDMKNGEGVHRECITAENVAALLAGYHVPTDFDLLSLDIDGVDWWVLRAVLRGGYRPRVMCVEINPGIPADPAVAIEYDPLFVNRGDDYFGASLSAFVSLGKRYGYTLVHLPHYNAFFVRSDLVPEGAPTEFPWRVYDCWPRDPQHRPWHLITEEDLA